MRAIMARLRGPRAASGRRLGDERDHEVLPAPDPDFEDPGIPEKRERPHSTPVGGRITMTYGDAEIEAVGVCLRLGLQAPDFADVGDLIRFAYGQGWLASEARRWRINLASADMADLIHQALNSPDTITEKIVGESVNHHLVRAIQQVVTYGVKSEPH